MILHLSAFRLGLPGLVMATKTTNRVCYSAAAEDLIEQTTGKMITQGTLDCELSINSDALLLREMRLDSLASLYPCGSLKAMSATPRKMTHGIGNRGRYFKDATMYARGCEQRCCPW